MNSPFIVPPFSPPPSPPITYVWWSWHPVYPYWSKSCWEAPTIEEAQEWLTKDISCGLRYYHNKLIEHNGHILTEVQDVPCERMEAWVNAKKKMINGTIPTDPRAKFSKGCKYDTDGDGNCPFHPQGCDRQTTTIE